MTLRRRCSLALNAIAAWIDADSTHLSGANLRSAAHASPHDEAVQIGVAHQDDFDAIAIHAELTGVVNRLGQTLGEFAGVFEAIGERIPASRQSSKLVPEVLVLTCLQLQNALLEGMDLSVLLDDGAEYLRKLSLSFEDAFRQVRLDGVDFSCIANVHQRPSGLRDAVDGVYEKVDVHARPFRAG